jgi:hypothetical protein
MAKRLRLPISAARSRLFQLADLVRQAGDDTVVVLEQRGQVEPVALVREARLAYLEERVLQGDRTRDTSFTLAGSLASELDDGALERLLREIREEWTAPPRDRLPARRKRPASRPARQR